MVVFFSEDLLDEKRAIGLTERADAREDIVPGKYAEEERHGGRAYFDLQFMTSQQHADVTDH